MIEFLFLDLDDTILDFRKAERVAIEHTMTACGIVPSEENISLYRKINLRHWEMLERNEIDREQLKVQRFSVLFDALGIQGNAKSCSEHYVEQLSKGCYFLPGAKEAVERLAKKYRLFLASNGNASVQAGRLSGTGLYPLFENVFISEALGANKPNTEFFSRAFAQIADFDPKKAMMVGDSLSSDIQGGINAGIATCWVNPRHGPTRNGIEPDYEIEALPQLEALLENL